MLLKPVDALDVLIVRQNNILEMTPSRILLYISSIFFNEDRQFVGYLL